MKLGIDTLLEGPGEWLSDGPVALVANQASLTTRGESTLEAVRRAAGIELACLLTAEHGFSGYEEDAVGVPDKHDARTGLELHSLYGPRRRPSRDLLESLSAVVFDVQEVGVRCYTYATTLALLLEASAGSGCSVVVCDRPNPLGPRAAGPPLDPALRSFLGYLPVPFQHGLTIGELALHHVAALERSGIVGPGDIDLRVAPLTGWSRHTPPPAPFVPPSPGLPALDAVRLYPGLVLLEGTNLSEGRGTSLPFQLLGAPWLEAYALAAELNDLGQPGLLFRPLDFVPESGKLAGQACHGVQLHVTDAAALSALAAVIEVLRHVRQRHPHDFVWVASASLPWATEPGAGEVWHEPVTGLLVDHLAGHASVRAVVEGELGATEAEVVWAREHAAFASLAEAHLLYGRG